MNFDTGLWDRLFGERGTIEIPGPNGSRRVQVTVKWLEKMQMEEKIVPSPDEHVTVHVLDPGGKLRTEMGLPGPPSEYYTATWTVGKDITKQDVDRFLDPATQAIYAARIWEGGVAKTAVLRKDCWDEVKGKMDAI